MGKRIKRVFSNHDQVLHLWANQTQADARCKNVFYSGRSCYSYGYHYELGRIVTFRGQTVALINNEGYSKTTQKHIISAWHAVEHLLRVKVNGDFDDGCIERGLLREQGLLLDELFGHFNSRTFWRGDLEFDTSEERLVSRIAEFNRTCAALKFKYLTLDVNDEYKALYREHIQRARQREIELQSPEAAARREAARAKRDAKAHAAAATAIANWRAGSASTDVIRNLNPQLLRVRGDVVETSRGAQVPLTHALRLLRTVRNSLDSALGVRVGHFSVDAVNDRAVKIGCHTIALSEAESVLGSALEEVQPVQLKLVGGDQ